MFNLQWKWEIRSTIHSSRLHLSMWVCKITNLSDLFSAFKIFFSKNVNILAIRWGNQVLFLGKKGKKIPKQRYVVWKIYYHITCENKYTWRFKSKTTMSIPHTGVKLIQIKHTPLGRNSLSLLAHIFVFVYW